MRKCVYVMLKGGRLVMPTLDLVMSALHSVPKGAHCSWSAFSCVAPRDEGTLWRKT